MVNITKLFKGKRSRPKKVIKTSKIIVKIPDYKPASYVPIYMKEAIKEDKRNFFFN